MIVRALALSAVLLSIGACHKSKPDRAADAMTKLIGFTDRACKCTETKCVRLAQKELADWLLANGAELSTLKFTPAQDAAGKKTSDDMAKCVEKLEQSPAAN